MEAGSVGSVTAGLVEDSLLGIGADDAVLAGAGLVCDGVVRHIGGSAVLNPAAELGEEAGRLPAVAAEAVGQTWHLKEAIEVFHIPHGGVYRVVVGLCALGRDDIVGLGMRK